MTLGRYILTIGFCLSLAVVHAQIECQDVTTEAGINHIFSAPTYMGGGAAFFDYDNDGDDDIWLAGGLSRELLYKNEGNGLFTEIGVEAGLEASLGMVSSGVITGDLNNDGYRDVFVLPHSGHHPLLFTNNGDGTFTEISTEVGIDNLNQQSYAAAMSDVNGDGFLDIYMATYIASINLIYDANGDVVGFDHECFDNLLFINNGNWTFTEMSADYGVNNSGCALATMFTDFDQDRDADLLVANDFGEWIVPNALYQNHLPNNTFTDISTSSGMDIGIYGMGIAVGDYDRDLDLDYYITNLGRNVLLENQNDNSFEDKTTQAGVEDTDMGNLLAVGWGTAFIDMDNDTDLDLFVCNGHVPSANFIPSNPDNKNRLFINNGNVDGTGFHFAEVALNSGLDDGSRGRGFAYSDYDNDGDLDILIINVNQHTSGDQIQPVRLFRNDIDNDQNWLKVSLEGISSNKDAFGSTIKIVVDGVSWLHDYNGGYGTHASQNSSIAHFGLGEANNVDSLIIFWPTGEESHFTSISVNQHITISEDGILSDTEDVINSAFVKLKTYPNPFTEAIQIQFQLKQSADIELEVFDMLGRQVKTFGEGLYPAGTHKIAWEPTSSDIAGRFVIRFKSADQIITQTVIRYH